MIHDDQGGAFSHNGLDFSLSPHVFKINDYNIFKFGLGATVSQYLFNIEDLINLEGADPSISQNQVNNNYNFSFGINYNFQKKTNFFLLGLSAKNLIIKDNLLESSLLINYRKNDKLEIYNYLKFRGNNLFQNDLIANYLWNQIKVGFFSRYFFNSILIHLGLILLDLFFLLIYLKKRILPIQLISDFLRCNLILLELMSCHSVITFKITYILDLKKINNFVNQ